MSISRLKTSPALRIVAKTHRPVVIPRTDEEIHAYEHEHRQRIASRDWSSVHIAGDRNPSLDLPERHWWKAFALMAALVGGAWFFGGLTLCKFMGWL